MTVPLLTQGGTADPAPLFVSETGSTLPARLAALDAWAPPVA
ncbi:hypothetical protein [Streptomyces sp. NPDC048142]